MNYKNLQTRQQRFVDTLASLYGKGDGDRNYTRTQVLAAADKCPNGDRRPNGERSVKALAVRRRTLFE